MTPAEKDAMALAAIRQSVRVLKFHVGDEPANYLETARAHLASRIAELEAELAALKPNAERYVWLRDKALYAEPDAEGLMTWCVRGRGNGHQYPEDGAALDAAIDAARHEPKDAE